MAAVLQYSVRAHIPGSLEVGGFTLENFTAMLRPLYGRVFLNTLTLCVLTAPLSLLLGYHPTIGAALLVIFLLGVSFGIHNFWTVQDQQAKQGEMVNFLKNMAILGLLLMTVAIPRPWLMSLRY